MSATAKLAITVAAIVGVSFTAMIVSHAEARATPAFNVGPSGPIITITDQGLNDTFSPAQLAAKVDRAITITNKDPNGVHNVTANDHSFSVDVPPQSSVTLTFQRRGTIPTSRP